MTAQHVALLVHEVAGLQRHALSPQERHIVAVGHEADILTVGLVGVQQSCLAGIVPDGGLVEIPHRQQQVGQLILGQLVQHIALILAAIRAPQQAIALRRRIIGDPGIVPRGNVVIPQRHRPIQQRAEFQAAVAVDTGVGGVSGAVFRHEMIHHVPAEGLHLVKYVKFHPQPVGHGTGVLGVVGAAAAAVAVGDQLQHGAVAVIALPPQQQRGSAAIHAAGHGHQHPFSFVLLHRFTSLLFGVESHRFCCRGGRLCPPDSIKLLIKSVTPASAGVKQNFHFQSMCFAAKA